MKTNKFVPIINENEVLFRNSLLAQDILQEYMNLLPNKNIEVEITVNTGFDNNDNFGKYDKTLCVSFYFQDALEYPIFNLPENLNEQTKKIFECKSQECSKSFLFDNEREKIWEIPRKHKAGFIAINRYEKGTHIEFMLSEHGYDIYDNIEITCQEVHKQVLTVGKSYYIGATKYEQDLLDDNDKQNFVPRKLIEIKINNSNSQYSFIFEGLKEPITCYSRGICGERQSTVHRLDYIIIEESKNRFIAKLIQKIGYDLNYSVSFNDTETTNKLINLNLQALNLYEDTLQIKEN